jgi:nucleotide-binding universal stress UspA family protein
MLDRILVPVDGSELADRILVHVRRVLLRGDAEVLFVRVLADAAPDVAGAEAHLERLRGSIPGAKVKMRVITGGDPAARILESAADFKPSLIALATHGRTGLARFYRGSVAERVLRSSPFPVLLANPFATPVGTGELGFRRILVALDGSLESAAVLPLVHDVARIYESEVLLVHVLEGTFEVAAGGDAPTAWLEAHAEAAAMLEHHRKTLGGVSARVLVLRGPAAAAILDAAEREGADLLALTTHGRSGVSRWLYGSVAEHVLQHARVPLLVQRTREAET